jgi:hypothetical protein
VALDVHAEDVGGVFERFVRSLCDLDAAGLTAAANLYLSLDDNNAANLFGCCFGFFWSVGNDSCKHGYSMCLKEIARLVFIQVHGLCPSTSKSFLTRSADLRHFAPA